MENVWSSGWELEWSLAGSGELGIHFGFAVKASVKSVRGFEWVSKIKRSIGQCLFEEKKTQYLFSILKNLQKLHLKIFNKKFQRSLKREPHSSVHFWIPPIFCWRFRWLSCRIPASEHFHDLESPSSSHWSFVPIFHFLASIWQFQSH